MKNFSTPTQQTNAVKPTKDIESQQEKQQLLGKALLMKQLDENVQASGLEWVLLLCLSSIIFSGFFFYAIYNSDYFGYLIKLYFTDDYQTANQFLDKTAPGCNNILLYALISGFVSAAFAGWNTVSLFFYLCKRGGCCLSLLIQIIFFFLSAFLAFMGNQATCNVLSEFEVTRDIKGLSSVPGNTTTFFTGIAILSLLNLIAVFKWEHNKERAINTKQNLSLILDDY